MELHLLLLAAAVAAAALLIFVLRRQRYQNHSLGTIPSPPAVPLLGHVQLAAHTHDAHRIFSSWHERYGPFVLLRLLHKRILLVADPAAVSAVITKGPHYLPRKPQEYTAFDVAHGFHGRHAMLTHQNEEQWRAARAALAPAYSLAEVRRRVPTVLAVLADVARRIEAKAVAADGVAGSAHPASPCVVNIDCELYAATMRIELEGFYGIPPSAFKADGHGQGAGQQRVQGQPALDCAALSADVEAVISTAFGFLTAPWQRLAYTRAPWLTPGGRKFHAARCRLVGACECVYDQHLLPRMPFEDDDRSVAACMMRIEDAARAGKYLDRTGVVAEISNSLLATETVPCSISWALFLLTQHPKVEAQLLEELTEAGVPCGACVDAVAAALAADPLLLLAQGRLPLLGRVVNESMRIYPAGGPASPRVAKAPAQVGPYRVPAGTIIMPTIYELHNYSANWPNPSKFDPDRWLDPKAAVDPRSGAPRFMPFSQGPKACLGQHIALLTTRAALVLLLAALRFRLAHEMGGPRGVEARTELAITLKVKGGLLLEAERRLASSVVAVAAAAPAGEVI